MPIKSLILLLIPCVLAGLFFLYDRPTYPILPDHLTFQRIDGNLQTLKELKGRPLLIAFWSPSCVICMQEVTQLNQLYLQLKGGDKFELLGLSMYYDRPDIVIQSSLEAKMLYPVYLDLQKTLSAAFGNIVVTPTIFLLNSQADIVYQHSGRIDSTIIYKKLRELIG